MKHNLIINNITAGKLLGIVSLVILFLLLFFIYKNTAYLLNAGFGWKNIITGELPENYLTGDGSTFYINDAAIHTGLPLVIFLGIASIFLIKKERAASINKIDWKTLFFVPSAIFFIVLILQIVINYTTFYLIRPF